MTVPTIVFLLLGGVASDRFDRRRLMVGADLGRAVAAGLLGVLALTGALELWHIVVIAAAYGTAARSLRRRSTRSSPSSCPASGSRRRTRSTSLCARSCCGWPAPRSAAS